MRCRWHLSHGPRTPARPPRPSTRKGPSLGPSLEPPERATAPTLATHREPTALHNPKRCLPPPGRPTTASASLDKGSRHPQALCAARSNHLSLGRCLPTEISPASRHSPSPHIGSPQRCTTRSAVSFTWPVTTASASLDKGSRRPQALCAAGPCTSRHNFLRTCSQTEISHAGRRPELLPHSAQPRVPVATRPAYTRNHTAQTPRGEHPDANCAHLAPKNPRSRPRPQQSRNPHA